LSSDNRAPLVQVLGLPSPIDIGLFRAQLNSQLRSPWWRVNFSNISVSSQSKVLAGNGAERERILQDGEMARLEIASRWASSMNSGFMFVVPLIAHHSGNMDQAIESWHKLFGLPNSNRGLRTQDSIEYVYTRDGIELLRLDRNKAGLGDVQLEWLYSAGNAQTTSSKLLRLGVKLPTGQRNNLTGSGSTSAYAEFGSTGRFKRLPALKWQLSAGAVWFEGGGVLAEIRRDSALTAHASVAKRVSSNWQLQAQLESHSRVYHSATDEIGQGGLQLSIGGGRALGKRHSIELYFTEDIVTRSSPDFGLGITLRHFPKK
ncbi:MAG: DUF3187 family protein, partial [Pseudomonadales bacterium]|nr:DUF3187 family protein [Pseudomonadales bacterium]